MKATTNKCLKAIRDLDEKGEPVTSMALRDALNIPDTDRSTALDIAAGWISTLRRYGFLRAVRGKKVMGPRRSVQVYELTDWGRRYKVGKKAKPALRVAANPSGKQG
jgi:hypothetical protein